MEIYDIIMLVVLAAAIVWGAVKGFAWQLASIASIVVSYVVAYKYRHPFSESIDAEPPWNRFLAMLILYVGTSLVIWAVFRMISGSIDRMKLREFDRQVGAIFGLAKGALLCTLITLFAVSLSGDRIRKSIVNSTSGLYIAHALDQSGAIMPPELQEVMQPYLHRFDEEFHSSPGDAVLDHVEGTTGQLTERVRESTDRFGDRARAIDLRDRATDLRDRTWPPQQAQQPIWNGLQR